MSKKKKLTIAAGSALCALSACLALAACGGNSHNVKEIQAKDATCTEAGNERYYACTDDGCGKIFSDAEGKNEIKLEDVVKPALGHDPQKVDAEETTCTKDGHIEYYDCSRCDVNFADAAGTQVLSNDEIFVAKYDHDLIEEMKAKAPTLEADGNVYHWHCDRCDVDFTNRSADKEIEDVVIPKLVKETGLTINVTTYDNATEEGAAPAGTFTLKGTEYPDSDTAGVSIAEGKLSVTELIADSYKFEIEGYYPVYFKVEKGVKEYNLDLYKYFHTHTVENENDKLTYDYIDGDLKIHINNVGWNDSKPIVHFADGKLSGESYMSEFTLRYENYHTAEPWYSRFAIRLGKSNNDKDFVGVMIYPQGSSFLVNDHIVSDMGFGDGADNGRKPVPFTGSQGTALNNAIKGDGLQVRAMRSGKLLSVLVNLDGEWVQIWSRNVEGLETEFAITATSPNNSTFTVSDMKYFSYEPISETHFGYFYEGEGDNKTLYSSFDGKQTTLAAQEIKKLDVTVKVEAYNGVQEKIDVPAGLKLTLTDEYDRDTITDATIADGVLSATQFLPGKYNITAIDGYYEVGSLYISADTAEYTLKLYQIDERFTIEGNDNRVIPSEVENDLQLGFSHVDFNAYNPPVVTLTDGKIAGDNYMTEFTVKYAFDASKDWGWTQRFAIRLGTTTEDGKVMGISFFAANDGELHVSALKAGDKGFGENDMKQPLAKGSDEAKAFCAALKGDGVTLRAVRQGNKLYLRAKVGDEWVLLYEMEASDLGAGIALSASSNDSVCTVSGISYADSFVAESQDRYAYFTKGDKYITESGEDTTLAGLAVVKRDMTVNVEVYDGLRNKIEIPSGLTFGLKDSIGREEKFTATVTEDGKLSVSAFYPDTYKIDDIDGYYSIGSIVFDRVNTEYTLKLYQIDDRFVVDGNDSRVTPSEVEGDLQLSFDHVGFDGNISIVEMTDEKISGTHYMTEFTIQYKDVTSWEWNKRFAIRLGKSDDEHKFLGLMLFAKDDNSFQIDETIGSDRGLGNGNEYGRTPVDFNNNSAFATALKGDGLQVRALRMGDRLVVSVKLGETWTKIWEKNVEGLEAGIAFMASSPDCTAVISNISYADSFVEDTDEIYAHFVMGSTFVTVEGDTATEDDLKVVKSEDITVNIEVYDGLRQKTDAPADLKLTLKDAYGRDTVTDATVSADGKLSVTAFYPCKYTVDDVDGYYAIGSIIFDKETKEYTLKLYQIDERFEISNNDSRVTPSEAEEDLQLGFSHVDFHAYNPPVVTLTNENVVGENYMTEFTVKYAFDAGKGWGYVQRFGIRLGTTSENGKVMGISFFAANDGELHVSVLKAGDNGFGENDTKQPLTKNSDEVKAFCAALKGDGVTLRAVRQGNKLYLRAKVGEKWVLLYETEISDLGAGIAISASSNDSVCTVSGISYADGFVADTDEVYAHFTKGDAFITADGDDATQEDLKVVKSEGITVNIEVYNGFLQKIDAPADLKLTMKDAYNRDTVTDATVSADGKLSVTAFYPCKYTVDDIDGYYTIGSVTFDKETKEYTLKLYQIDERFERDINDSRVTASEVEGDLQIGFNNVGLGSNPLASVKLTNENVAGTNYLAELTLQAKNVTAYGWATRIAIYTGSAANGTRVGFTLRLTGENGFDVGTSEWGNTNLEPSGTKSPDAAKQSAFMTALRGSGVKIRVSRNGDMHYIRAFLNDEWVLLYQAKMEGLGTGLYVLATTNDTEGITVSNISYADGFVAETNEKYAHFTKGETYITVSGEDTTLEELDIKKIENLTVNVVVYDKEGDGKQEVSAPTCAFNLYNEVARFTEEGVTIQGGGALSATALYPGKYIIMIDGYLPVTFTVDKNTTEYNLELYPNSKAGNVSVDSETGDITMNNGWNGGVLTTLKDDIMGENYMTEFTLKYQFTEGKSWGYTERFSLVLGMSPVDEKPIGFMFFMKGDNEIGGANCVSNDIRWFGDGHEGFAPFEKDSADVTAINDALKGEGLKVRGVRNGNKLTVYFLIGNEWKQAWTKTVEGLSPYIGVTAAHNNSTLTVTGITFGAYVEATDTVAAHLVVGSGDTATYYTLDGVQTTLDNLAITE